MTNDYIHDATVGNSKAFNIIPVDIASVQLTPTYGSYTPVTTLVAGNENLLGYLVVTADTSSNNWNGGATHADLLIRQIDFEANSSNIDANTFAIERIGGNGRIDVDTKLLDVDFHDATLAATAVASDLTLDTTA